MNLPEHTEIFLGRQPILDASQNVVAYELLFRSGWNLSANVTNDVLATATVITNTVSHFGIDNVLDKQLGFINVSYELLMSDVLELLPKERIVLEILETVKIDPKAVERCRELKAKGFRLALDDFEYDDSYDELFEVVDIIKFDMLLSSPEQVEASLERIRRWPQIQLLAEKVEDLEQFHRCHAWGFSLFQGYFFARPAILSGKKANPRQLVLLRVMNQIMNDVEIREIENTFKESPNLVLGLLRLVNSVGMGLRLKISSLQQALVVLGHKHLQRWVQLLLYVQDGTIATNPLMQMAATRARTMELLCQSRSKQVDADAAFMTGILSLVDVLLGMNMEDILNQLSLSEDVRDAILLRQGYLGRLLALMESVEIGDFSSVAEGLESLHLTAADLSHAELEAMQWVGQLGEMVD
ncbi:diguanylate phosphodiesterase [Novimethylophilus kurashikiensis]|uniref:Diguanylate phosphodiesterase n=1 Tax=Novimethylophilus kurashikiensis TaxID=1825523 RepID=A0A2R5F6I2_9PROT|nr:EAL domain-containing protein [Novimethylophilus kurashikiensis]GBG13705.1 diguanylate phosphodiesterase [Novimethylophilus kurashikiensis]